LVVMAEVGIRLEADNAEDSEEVDVVPGAKETDEEEISSSKVLNLRTSSWTMPKLKLQSLRMKKTNPLRMSMTQKKPTVVL